MGCWASLIISHYSPLLYRHIIQTFQVFSKIYGGLDPFRLRIRINKRKRRTDGRTVDLIEIRDKRRGRIGPSIFHFLFSVPILRTIIAYFIFYFPMLRYDESSYPFARSKVSASRWATHAIHEAAASRRRPSPYSERLKMKLDYKG